MSFDKGRTSEPLLTVTQAAEHLQIATGTLRHWVSQRRIEFVRVGRKAVRFRLSALDRFIEKHTQKEVR